MLIASMCEDYNILGKPMLPKFKCPKDFSEDQYLRHLCREGWKSRLAPTGKVNTEQSKQVYADQIKKELDVISEANLAGYFLIVRDIVNSVVDKNHIPGPGRGSAAGCLVSYLVGITQVDPI